MVHVFVFGPLCWQGKLKEAIELFKKVLAIEKKAYDEDHPTLATTYNNIALAYEEDVS